MQQQSPQNLTAIPISHIIKIDGDSKLPTD